MARNAKALAYKLLGIPYNGQMARVVKFRDGEWRAYPRNVVITEPLEVDRRFIGESGKWIDA